MFSHLCLSVVFLIARGGALHLSGEDPETTSKPLMRSVSISSAMSPSMRVDPNPDTAAKVMDWWREHGREHGKTGRSRSRHRVSGLGMSGRGDVQGMNGDVLSREAFETLLPCVFHADEVHDTVRTHRNHTSFREKSLLCSFRI